MASATVPLPPRISLPAWEQASADQAVMIIDGNSKVTVRAGQLHVIDGPPGQTRTRTVARVPRTVERVLILASHGYRTSEAERWLAWAKIPWAALDTETGEFLSTSDGAATDARLLRAQSRACEGGDLEPVALEITRHLITEKIRGQLANIAEFFTLPETELYLKERLNDAESAGTFDAINSAEGQAASAYWQAWSGRVHVPFSPDDLLKVPGHWECFTQRPSLATDYAKNSNATDPVNAVLNYVYRIAETECLHALHAVGLSPQLGINHADKPGRDSLALDLIEVVRPVCDRIALQIFDTGLGIPYDQATGKPQYFDRRWVTETREGICRLVPPMTHQLASHAAEIGAAVRPHAYRIARMLADAATGQVTVARPKGVKLSDRVKTDHRQYPKNRLRRGVTADDIIPADLWSQIEPLIPPRDPHTRGTKPPHPRIVCAALAARFILGVPWSQVPGASSYMTVTRWRDQWERNGTWPKVRQICEAHGHLSALAE